MEQMDFGAKGGDPMENENELIKSTIAANITELRKKSNMTQQDLADALSYTDKAVSKWERAESIPDVVILKRIADLFGVTVDYLLSSEHTDIADIPLSPSHRLHKRALITCIGILLVWLIATFAFVVVMPTQNVFPAWLIFLYAVPLSMIVWLVFNSVWFNRKINYVVISILIWATLASIHLTALTAFHAHNFWMAYLLGIPSQVIVLLWSGIGRRPRRKQKKEPKDSKPSAKKEDDV